MPEQAAHVLHVRLLGTPDYKALADHQDKHTEHLLGELERGGHTLERFESLAGELRGLRAARGATTRTRGQK